MKSSLAAAVVAFHAFVAAAPSSRHVRHETRDESTRWIKRETIDASLGLPMRIGLTQGNLDRGHDLLMEVSDPMSSKYGKYYSAEEVHELFAPSAETVATVRAWLEEAGIAAERITQSANKQWLQFDSHTAEAEELLKTKFHVYEHSQTGKSSVGCDDYHVMEHLQPHIDYITPGVRLMELKSRDSAKVKRAAPPGARGWKGPIVSPLKVPVGGLVGTTHCASGVTPACIAALYDIPAGTTAVKGNELGIFEDVAEYLDSSDLNLFFSHFAKNIPNGTFPTVEGIDGAKNINNPNDAGDEALLDFQISYPIIYPQNSILFLTDDDYYEENYDFVGLFNTFLDGIDGSYCTYSAFGETGDNSTADPTYPDPNKGGYKGKLQCGVYTPTNVISLSYELAEFEEGTTANYQKRQCNEYMKLGMQGVSVVFSSGDSGVGSSWGCAGTNGDVFNPNFPSNCPYVTSVGATAIVKGSTPQQHKERAVTQFPSGGGFSNFFARPSYQNAAVEGFFNSSSAPTYPYYTGSSFGNGVYNRSGRGIPDVSAIGQNVVIYLDGQPSLIGGTSASAPTFASILTRINEARLTAGKSTVGFVNPTLYANPSAFRDITVGSNPSCNSNGFSAAVGWDPLTGLGTPDYASLLKVFMNAS